MPLLRYAPWAGKAAGLRPFKAIADAAIGLSSDGPAEGEGSFAVVAEAQSSSGKTRRVRMTGGPVYELTAVAAAYCASRAADPSFDRRGALTPSQAFGANALLEALAPAGLEWHVEGA